MYTDDDLDAAVAAGVLPAQAAAALRAFVAQRKSAKGADEEHFRLLTGFNDVFVAVAAVLILVAIAMLASRPDGLAGGLVAAASWAMAEYFTRRRRMALPSILLLLGFVGGVWQAVFRAMHAWIGPVRFDDTEGLLIAALSTGLAALAAYGHWRRFRVPITVAAGAAAALAMVVTLILSAVPALRDFWLPLLFLGGLVMFALAMRWDASDRQRTTRRSDVAFWLHLAAAPLLVHPVFSMLGLIDGSDAPLAAAAAAIAVYLLLAVVALAVDRRALLVSSLAYLLYAVSDLIQATGATGEAFALSGLVIGSALLMLSALWQRTRRMVVAALPQDLQDLLPAA